MCGIFVAFNFNNHKFDDHDFIQATKTVSHRGPDNIGYFKEGNCFLGHTRLSIIGIEANSNQPFYFEDFVVVFNGEIFNYIELRDELVGYGYKFETRSDTEVIIKAFKEWGGDCFSRFNGMWALVIYNRNNKTLTASRDRFGQKPMFVMREGNSIYFGSEFQQLVHFSNKEVDYELIQMFLKEGTYEGEGRTFFRSIEEFPKAHYCEIDINNKCTSFRYWDYWNGEIKKVDDTTFSEFSELLQDAVKLRLRADVPVGLLLSGGVDSTIVATYLRQFSDSYSKILAFNYSSKDADDESSYAKKVADKLNLELTVREQDQIPIEYRNRLKQLVKHMGRGHSSPAIVSVDYLYESVSRSGIKVVLDGQGADELLAGYKNYFVLVIPWFFIRGKLKQATYCLIDQFRFGFLLAIVLYLRNTMPPSLKRIMRWVYGYERFFSNYKDFPNNHFIIKHTSKIRNNNALNRYLIWQHNLILEDLLFYGDIISMKNSTENRSPYLDHRLVDFAFSRDEKLKLWNGIDKYALRTTPVYRLFEKVLDRKKIGFSSDINNDTKLFMAEELKNSPILAWPIFSEQLSDFINRSGFDSSKYERFLFRLYQVHLWNEIFMKDHI